MLNADLHILDFGMQILELGHRSPQINTVENLKAKVEGDVGSKTTCDAWYHVMNCVRGIEKVRA